jgi:hypothetical protein
MQCPLQLLRAPSPAAEDFSATLGQADEYCLADLSSGIA